MHINIIPIKELFFDDSPVNCLLKYPDINPARQYDKAESPINDPLKRSSIRPATNPEIIPAICPRVYPKYITKIITKSGVMLYFEIAMSQINETCITIITPSTIAYFKYEVKYNSGYCFFKYEFSRSSLSLSGKYFNTKTSSSAVKFTSGFTITF